MGVGAPQPAAARGQGEAPLAVFGEEAEVDQGAEEAAQGVRVGPGGPCQGGGRPRPPGEAPVARDIGERP